MGIPREAISGIIMVCSGKLSFRIIRFRTRIWNRGQSVDFAHCKFLSSQLISTEHNKLQKDDKQHFYLLIALLGCLLPLKTRSRDFSLCFFGEKWIFWVI